MSLAAIAYIMHCRCFNFMTVVPVCYGLPEDGEQSTKHVRGFLYKDNLYCILHVDNAFVGISVLTLLKLKFCGKI